ncbi:HET-domain-containing protein [Xylariaceae sp. FL1272]|nr:HET-domain-containing protein [Xylariaceae sp. FL1272]
MLCDVCREGLDGIWDPEKTKRLGELRDFPNILQRQFPNVEDDEFDRVLGKLNLQEPEKYVFGHHVDHDSLLRSRRQGCVACAEFSDVNDEDDVDQTFSKLGYYSVFCISLSRKVYCKPTMLVYLGDPFEEFAHEMVAHHERDHINSAISHSTASVETWALVQSWLRGCLDHHETCRSQRQEKFTPSRLLQLGADGGDEKTFKIVFRAEVDPDEPYVTLSHCWGPAPPHKKLRLTKSSQATLRDILPVRILPQTFRDAFEIVERLQVRYLWIDRLCIVQDSAEDWRAEASMMQTVYRHGYLNIAALGSSDDEGGCFYDRDPALVAPTILDLGPRNDQLASFYRLEAEDGAWGPMFEGEPLLCRAWVFQERILATRTLYFGSKQVFWECCETNYCETIPNSQLTRRSRRQVTQEGSGPGPYTWKTLIDPRNRSRKDTMTDWSRAVEMYCQCKLSFPGDKLVALSGLAKHMGSMARRRGGGDKVVYLAGLWENTMPESLLWTPRAQAHRPQSYRAPSWSWAAIDGDIRFVHTSGSKWHVDLVEVTSVPRTADPTGELTGGAVRLRGSLAQTGALRRIKTFASERDTYRIGSFHRVDTGARIDGLGDRSAYLQLDTSEDFQSQLTFLLFSSRPHEEFSFVSTQGLALVPNGEPIACYRRVGYIFVETTVDFSDNFQTLDLDEKV